MNFEKIYRSKPETKYFSKLRTNIYTLQKNINKIMCESWSGRNFPFVSFNINGAYFHTLSGFTAEDKLRKSFEIFSPVLPLCYFELGVVITIKQ